MKIHDITLTITPKIPVWPGDMKVTLERVKKIENGETDNLSQIHMGVHTGTHMDAPFHFVQDGKKIDEIPLETFVGACQVIQVDDSVNFVTAKEIKEARLDTAIPRVLVKTRNAKEWLNPEPLFNKDFVGISADGAAALVELGMRLVGLDYLSVAPFNFGKPVHDVFLQAGLVLLEGVDLSKVEPGRYQLIALPLKLGNTEGAPVRAVLIED